MGYRPQFNVGDFGPLKGGFMVMNDEVIKFLSDALYDISEAHSDELQDEDPGAVPAALIAGVNTGTGLVWKAEQDRFGEKAYTEIPYATTADDDGKGILRVTVVLKRGALSLDIRPWGTYKDYRRD